MTSTLLLILAMFSSYIGFACLALAMPRHWAQAGGLRLGPMTPRRRLRRCGFALLGTACALSVYRDGPSFGSVLALVLLPAAAIAVVLTLAFRPRMLLPASLSRQRRGGRRA